MHHWYEVDLNFSEIINTHSMTLKYDIEFLYKIVNHFPESISLLPKEFKNDILELVPRNNVIYLYIAEYCDQHSIRTIGLFDNEEKAKEAIEKLKLDEDMYYGSFTIEKKEVSAKCDTYYCSVHYATSMGRDFCKLKSIFYNIESLPEKRRNGKCSSLQRMSFNLNETYTFDKRLELI
jgi:hypothetical protein